MSQNKQKRAWGFRLNFFLEINSISFNIRIIIPPVPVQTVPLDSFPWWLRLFARYVSEPILCRPASKSTQSLIHQQISTIPFTMERKFFRGLKDQLLNKRQAPEPEELAHEDAIQAPTLITRPTHDDLSRDMVIFGTASAAREVCFSHL